MALVVTEARSFSAGNRQEALPSLGSSDIVSASHPSLETASDSCCGEVLRPFRADDGRFMSVCMKCGKQTTHTDMAHYGGSPWIGVDLDGTLAKDAFDFNNPERIGEPVEPMMRRVRQWLAEGKTVKIFTARASIPRQAALVKQWLQANELPDLEVTNAKDFKMVELWDDRAVQVDRNSGAPVKSLEPQAGSRSANVTVVARRRSQGSFLSKLRMFLTL